MSPFLEPSLRNCHRSMFSLNRSRWTAWAEQYKTKQTYDREFRASGTDRCWKSRSLGVRRTEGVHPVRDKGWRDGEGQTLSDANLLYYIYNIYNWSKYYRITNWTDCLVPHMVMRTIRRRPTPDTDTRGKSPDGWRFKDAVVSHALLYNSIPSVG